MLSILLFRLETGWYHDTVYRLIGPNATSTITAMLQLPPPSGEERSPEVHLYLNPACQFKVEVQANLPRMWGQMVIAYLGSIFPSL